MQSCLVSRSQPNHIAPLLHPTFYFSIVATIKDFGLSNCSWGIAGKITSVRSDFYHGKTLKHLKQALSEMFTHRCVHSYKFNELDWRHPKCAKFKEIMQSVRAKQSIMRRVNINQCDDQGTIPVTMQMNQSVILPFTAGL